MPSGLLIRLRPVGPWRIGPDSGDRDRVDRIYHSDSLYSAVTSAMARLGMLDDWLDATARASGTGGAVQLVFPLPGRYAAGGAAAKSVASAAVFQGSLERRAVCAAQRRRIARGGQGDSPKTAGSSTVPANACSRSARRPRRVRSASRYGRARRSIAKARPFRRIRRPASSSRPAADCGAWCSFLTMLRGNNGPRRSRPRSGCSADSGFGGKRSQGWGRAEMPEITRRRWSKFTLNTGRSSGLLAALAVPPGCLRYRGLVPGKLYADHSRRARRKRRALGRSQEADAHGGGRLGAGGFG